jgi:epoxyqueuosine reductase
MDDAKTIVLVLQNYFTDIRQTDPEAPVISRYAYGNDYHEVVRSKLQLLLSTIQDLLPGTKGLIFTDSSPILEKAWSVRAGLGWIGKNSLLISPEHGSFCFIGGILLNADLGSFSATMPADLCGNCSLCLEACPTKALVAPRILDARRCIAYQTIELKDAPDISLAGRFMNRVYGCDICQEVCPWNRNARRHTEETFHPSPELMDLSAEKWFRMNPALFEKLFSGSPVRRAGFEKLKRNLEFLTIKSAANDRGETI